MGGLGREGSIGVGQERGIRTEGGAGFGESEEHRREPAGFVTKDSGSEVEEIGFAPEGGRVVCGALCRAYDKAMEKTAVGVVPAEGEPVEKEGVSVGA